MHWIRLTALACSALLSTSCTTDAEWLDDRIIQLVDVWVDTEHRALLDTPTGLRMRELVGVTVVVAASELGVPQTDARSTRTLPVCWLIPDEPGWLGAVHTAQRATAQSEPTVYESDGLVRVGRRLESDFGWEFSDVPSGRYDLVANWKLVRSDGFESEAAHATVEVAEDGTATVVPSSAFPAGKRRAERSTGEAWRADDWSSLREFEARIADTAHRLLLDSPDAADLRGEAGVTIALGESDLRPPGFYPGAPLRLISAWLVPDRPGWLGYLHAAQRRDRDTVWGTPKMAKLARFGAPSNAQEQWVFSNVPSGSYDLVSTAGRPGVDGAAGHVQFTLQHASVDVSAEGVVTVTPSTLFPPEKCLPRF